MSDVVPFSNENLTNSHSNHQKDVLTGRKEQDLLAMQQRKRNQ